MGVIPGTAAMTKENMDAPETMKPAAATNSTRTKNDFHSEKAALVEMHHREEAIRDEKRAIVATMIEQKHAQQSGPMDNVLSLSSRLSNHGGSIRNLTMGSSQTHGLPAPGAYHAEGRAFGQAPSWTERNVQLRAMRQRQEQERQAAATGNSDNESGVVVIHVDSVRSLSNSTSHQREQQRDQLSSGETMGDAADVLEAASPEASESSAAPVEAGHGDHMSIRKRQRRLVLFITISCLFVGIAVTVGVILGVGSSNSNSNDGSHNGDSSNGKCSAVVDMATLVETCPASTGIPLPECAKAEYDRLKNGGFLDIVYSSNDNITIPSCSPQDFALASMAIAISDNGSKDQMVLMTDQMKKDMFLLLVVHFATGGTNWIQSPNWGQGIDSCQWPGVSCRSDGTIQGVRFRFRGLQGSGLPTEIGLFANIGTSRPIAILSMMSRLGFSFDRSLERD